MKTVLLIDDVPENRHLLRAIFESIGWEVVEAANGAKALDRARASRPDLVISDILMPGMDGYALCREWKHDEGLRGIPFWFCTATFTDERDESLAAEMGADAFVRQPVDPADFRRQVRELEENLARGVQPNLPRDAPGSPRLLADYADVLAHKLDDKSRAYHAKIDELRVSQAELDFRVRELSFLHDLNDCADAGSTQEELFRMTAKGLPKAFPVPAATFVRMAVDGVTYVSSPFHETPEALVEPLPGDTCGLTGQAVIEVFFDHPSALPVSGAGQRLLRSVAKVLCLELQRRASWDKLDAEKRTADELLKLGTAAPGRSEAELIEAYLEAAVTLTGSRIGYLHFVNEAEGTIELSTWSAGALRECQAVEDSHYPIAQAGVWADCVRERRPVVHNDYAHQARKRGMPAGHAPVMRHLSVPVHDGDQIVMIIGVGNREAAYGDKEIATMQAVADALWHTVDCRRREQKLEAANERLVLLRTALESASHAVAITDRSGLIEWVNPAFCQATGYAADELIGRNPRVLKSGRHDAAFYQDLWATILAGEVWRGTITNCCKDGHLIDEETSITPVRNSQGEITHFIAIKQDVTVRREMAERELRSQRMESVGLLAGGVAHDLNNVLAPMMMSLELLREELPEAERLELVETLELNCQRAAGIIRQVLTFSRGVEGERVLLQMRHLAKDMVKIARETFPRNLTIEMDVPARLWPTVGDPTQLHQVLLNLFVNARDALPDGGRLTVTGGNVELAQGLSFLGAEIPAGRYVKLSVADTGTGIAPEQIGRIFEPFYTTKALGKGTGLGLSTVLGIVRSHHGLIDVTSTPGEGTRFDVYLPASDAAAAADPEPAAEIPDGTGQTILVVDDEPVVLEMTRRLLEKHGYQVLAATDGAEGVALFAQQRDRIALVLTDIMMPVMDGVAFVRALQTILPAVKVIGSTGFAGDAGGGSRIEELAKLGVREILEKPYRPQELLGVLATNLAE